MNLSKTCLKLNRGERNQSSTTINHKNRAGFYQTTSRIGSEEDGTTCPNWSWYHLGRVVRTRVTNTTNLTQLDIWVIWRPNQHLKLAVVLLKFLLCGRVHHPAERGHSHQGMLFPWRGAHDLLLKKVVRVKVTSTASTSLPSSHSASCCPVFPGKWCTCTQSSTWGKIKHD